MRVAIPTSGTDAGRSGIGRYLTCLLDGLAGLEDCTVELLVRNGESFGCSDHVRLRPCGRGFDLPVADLAWNQLVVPLHIWRGRFDVAFLPAANRRVPASLPCPAVGMVHDMAAFHVPGKYDAARMLYIRRILPRLIRRLSRIVTCSHCSKADIIEHCDVPPDRVVVVPNAVDAKRFRPRDPGPASRRLASRLGLAAPYILYVSRIEHPGKNHLRLIRAFEWLKSQRRLPHRLVLAGSECERARVVLQAAGESHCGDDILFTGFVDDDLLVDLYAAAELAVVPSLYEGFGLPVLEAMACGVPVTCANRSSLPEVGGEAALYFDPYDVGQIAGAVERLIDDDGLRSRLRQAGLERSRAFTWESTARRTVDVMRSVAAEAK